MRPLVLLSLLSLIGVINCRPQEVLKLPDTPIEAQYRYHSKRLQKLPDFEHPSIYHINTPYITSARKSVRKTDPQNINVLNKEADHTVYQFNTQNTPLSRSLLPRNYTQNVYPKLVSPKSAEKHIDIPLYQFNTQNILPRKLVSQNVPQSVNPKLESPKRLVFTLDPHNIPVTKKNSSPLLVHSKTSPNIIPNWYQTTIDYSGYGHPNGRLDNQRMETTFNPVSPLRSWYQFGEEKTLKEPNVVKSNVPYLYKSQNFMDNTPTNILSNLFQRRIDFSPRNLLMNVSKLNRTRNIPLFDRSINVVNTKFTKNLTHKDKSTSKPKFVDTQDIFNVNAFNLTKISQNDYKITSKNKFPNTKRVTLNVNHLNSKNSTKNNALKNRPKPLRPFFAQENPKPLFDSQNKWFQLKLKQPGSTKNAGTEKNYDYSTIPGIYLTNSLSSTQNPNIYNPNYSIGPNGDKVNIGNTITLSPEVVSISQGSHTLAGPELALPCTNLHITNNLLNKQACQDVEIVINNHIHTENNIYSDEEAEAGFIESPPEYEEDYVESDEATENAIISEDEYADELAQEAVLAENPVDDILPVEASVVENPVQAATGQTGGSSGQFPNRPNRPSRPSLPGSSSSEEDEEEDDGGVFSSGGIFSWIGALNPFNFPLISLLAAPLTILFTGALGISTFFLPWTVLPTLFLSRKAKNSAEFEPSRPSITRPDGWFWHNKYQTWINMGKQNNARIYNDVGDFIVKLIEEFGRKYTTNYNESWKRRKKI